MHTVMLSWTVNQCKTTVKFSGVMFLVHQRSGTFELRCMPNSEQGLAIMFALLILWDLPYED